MDIFTKRPLFLSCMLFLACSTAGYFISGIVKAIIIIVATISLIFSLILAGFKYYSSDKKNAFLSLILCFVMIILSFSSSLNYYDRNTGKYSEIYGTENMVEGVVSSVEYETAFSSKYKISVTKLNGAEDKHNAYLECDYSGALVIGDRISLKAVANDLPSGDSAQFNERAEALSHGIFVVYSSENESSLFVTEYSDYEEIETFFQRLNSNLSGILTGSVKGEEGNLSSALLLGNKSLLARDIGRDFRRVGASHILALSGMHMSIIMGFAMFILKYILRKRNTIIIILTAFSIFYLALTGFSVSATRSVIMLLMVYIAFLVSGVPDSLTALSVAGFLIVLVSPGSILDAGFWLSFSATLGILVFASALKEYFDGKLEKCESKLQLRVHKFIYSIISAIFTCFAAIIPLIIVMCIFIKEISVLSVLSSLVLSIPTSIVIILSMLLLPFAAVPYISEALVWGIRETAGMMIDYCSEFSDYENIVFSLNYPFATVMAIILGVALLYSFVSRCSRPFTSLIPFLVSLLVFVGVMFVYEDANADNLKVSYINSSQKSDIIVMSDEREAVICDISNGSKKSYQLALNEIYKARATEIKAILLTRYTNAHVATLYSVFAENKVRAVWVPYPVNEDEQDKLDKLYGFAKQNGVDVYVYKQGERLEPFEDTFIEHTNEYVERSVVPIDLVGIYTGKEHLTYVSPAYNESDLHEIAEYHFSKSKYVIFGGRGPKVKKGFHIENMDKLKTVIFANNDLAAHFIEPEFSFASYYLVPKEGSMEFYLAQ